MAFASLALSRRTSKRNLVRAALTIAGAFGFTVLASQVGTAGTAHAASGLYYSAGYSVQGSWLCYGWNTGTYHCTQHWHRSGSTLVSDNPGWVPNVGNAAYVSGSHTTALPPAGGNGGHVGVTYTTYSATSATPGNISAWAYTGHPAYGMSDFAGDPYGGYFGSCTWYAWYRHQNEPQLMRLGNAAQWAWNAPGAGLRTGTTPAVGATVIFQPGVQGASPEGHAAHVEAVYSNGWFLVSEMSFYWNGGGWGRVSFRYAHTGAGVSFIY